MAVQVYRYTSGSVSKEALKTATNKDGKVINYVEWPQCCHMAWLGSVTYEDTKNIAQAMVDNDFGYVATFLCSIAASTGSYTTSCRQKLIKLGFKKIADVPGPDILPDPLGNMGMYHGQAMEIWMYSMVEHKTYRNMKEAFKEYLS